MKRTYFEAYTDFCNTFTVSEIENVPALAATFEHLQLQNSINPEGCIEKEKTVKAIRKIYNQNKNGN